LDIVNGSVVIKEDPDNADTMLPVGPLVGPVRAVIGRGWHVADRRWRRIAHGSQAAEIEVDTLTGSITVTKYAAAHDIGKALNPRALEQQIEGGVVQALGAALTEQMLIDSATGLPLTDNILEYKALSIKDVPFDIDVILVEHAKAYGVYGAHGIGEPAIALGGPVISNALFNAIGVRVPGLPLGREKILAAIKNAA
jgi:CO/xanthine dehydrogenase Mo-binding subunit